MSRSSFRSVLVLSALGVWLGAGGVGRTQEPSLKEMQDRLERLEQRNQQLERAQMERAQMERMQQGQPVMPMPVMGTRPLPPAGPGALVLPIGLNPPDVQNVSAPNAGIQNISVGDKQPDAKKEEKKKEEDLAAHKLETEGYRIGSDLTMKVSWKDGVFISTPQEDFTFHPGGWIQWDNVWYDQTPLMRAPPGARPGAKQGIFTGVSQGGVGDFQDGTYFRRARIMMEGDFWENYEYNIIFALENDTFSTTGLDEFWVGARNIPFIGTIRAGHVKNAIGLEADMSGSSRAMTFMERSSYSEAIENNQNFVTGLWFGNNYFDKRATSTFVVFRPDQGASTGEFFGDGFWGMQSRLTALPIYDCEGRHLLHLGISGGWRNGNNNSVVGSTLHQFQLRARPEQRDDVPGGGASNADNNRMIDTNVLAAEHQWLMGLETLYVWGPFSAQAEYGWTWLDNVSGVAKAGSNTPTPALIPSGNYVFSGGYVQLAYTLTGENRAYDQRLGRLNTYYFGRKGPFTNAWFVRDEDGHLDIGWGAWEIAARYSYVTLNDGDGLSRVQGGRMDGWSFGLNWYLNTNLKVQFEYIYDHRYDLADGGTPGYVSGFGTRLQFMF